VGPLRSEPLQILDGRLERWLATERERFHIGQLTLLGDVLGPEPVHGVTGAVDEVGGAALDQEQQGRGAPGRQPAQYLVPGQQYLVAHDATLGHVTRLPRLSLRRRWKPGAHGRPRDAFGDAPSSAPSQARR